MTRENTGPKSAGPVTGGPHKGRSAMDHGTSHHVARPVSRKSEAIIKEVSVRRRAA